MNELKKSNQITDESLNNAAGGRKDEVNTTTYNREVQGDGNIIFKGTGEKILGKWDALKEVGVFDTLDK